MRGLAPFTNVLMLMDPSNISWGFQSNTCACTVDLCSHQPRAWVFPDAGLLLSSWEFANELHTERIKFTRKTNTRRCFQLLALKPRACPVTHHQPLSSATQLSQPLWSAEPFWCRRCCHTLCIPLWECEHWEKSACQLKGIALIVWSLSDPYGEWLSWMQVFKGATEIEIQILIYLSVGLSFLKLSKKPF